MHTRSSAMSFSNDTVSKVSVWFYIVSHKLRQIPSYPQLHTCCIIIVPILSNSPVEGFWLLFCATL